MSVVIKYDPEREKWAAWVNGFPTAYGRKESLIRHFPDAEVDDGE